MNSATSEVLVSGTSMNGVHVYEMTATIVPGVTTDCDIETTFRRLVMANVQEKFGVTPRGVGFLLDLRTITISRM